MHSCRIMALLIGALSLCSCDLIVDKIREGANGNAPGGGSSSGPTPPSLPTSDAAAPPVLPPPPPPSRCQDWTGAGDESTCKTQDEWKRYAYDACQAQNLILNDYGVGGVDCGAGMTRMVKYQCCGPVPPDPGNSGSGGGSGTPGSTPGTGSGGTSGTGGGSCTGGSEGGATSCKSAETWRQYAAENCARQNLVLNDIGFGESCGTDFYRYMKYSCCPGK
jgi:hypothetical protein